MPQHIPKFYNKPILTLSNQITSSFPMMGSMPYCRKLIHLTLTAAVFSVIFGALGFSLFWGGGIGLF